MQFEQITPCCSVFVLLKDVPGTCGSVVHVVNKASPTPQQNPQYKPSNPKKPLSPKTRLQEAEAHALSRGEDLNVSRARVRIGRYGAEPHSGAVGSGLWA